MKPIDHPDFFTRPPPPGRSRESLISLDAQGRFRHEGQLLGHRRLSTGFARWIRRHPGNGRFILCNGYDWSYFEVEDVPYFVDAVSERDGAPWLTLFDGSGEWLEAASVELAEDDALYCRVKAGSMLARFRPSAQAALHPFVVEGAGGEPELCVRGQRFPILERPAPGQLEGEFG